MYRLVFRNDIFVENKELFMRYTLLIIAVALCFSSCMKKNHTEQTNCYSCLRNDSVTSNIPKLNNAHYPDSTLIIYKCAYIESQKNFFEKINTYTDTLYFKNDTLELDHFVTKCTLM